LHRRFPWNHRRQGWWLCSTCQPNNDKHDNSYDKQTIHLSLCYYDFFGDSFVSLSEREDYRQRKERESDPIIKRSQEINRGPFRLDNTQKHDKNTKFIQGFHRIENV
jgi:hypothetical protein